MYGESPACVFLVFSNAGPGGDEALARWYMEVHGPDAFAAGSFSALHRYQALGAYDARFLAVWEGAFTSIDDVRSRIVPGSRTLKDKGRITSDLVVVWSGFHFLTDAEFAPGATTVNTLTLVEGGDFDAPGSSTYRYGTPLPLRKRRGPRAGGGRVVRAWPRGHGPPRPLPEHVRPPRGLAPAGDRDERAVDQPLATDRVALGRWPAGIHSGPTG